MMRAFLVRLAEDFVAMQIIVTRKNLRPREVMETWANKKGYILSDFTIDSEFVAKTGIIGYFKDKRKAIVITRLPYDSV